MHDDLLIAAFESASIGMALVALDGRILRVNRATCALLGYEENELRARRSQELTHPADVDADRIANEEILAGQISICRIEKRFIHKQGHTTWASVSNFIVRDQSGQPQCFFAQIEDISIQKEVELARETFFQLPLALHFVAGFDGYFKKLSSSWKNVLGYPLEDILAVPYMDLVHPEDRESTANAAQQLSGGEHVFLFENRYRHMDGSYRWLLWVAVSARDQQMIYGVALDYTTKKETELELEQTLLRMEKLMGELKASQGTIDTLRQGLVTVCSWTKRIQHEGRWMTMDEFLKDHLHLKLTHGISADAADQMIAEFQAGKKPE
jgi:PAS domain S-box-containing protein